MFTSYYNYNMKSEEQFTCQTTKEILSFVWFKFQTKRCIFVIKAFTRSRHLGKNTKHLHKNGSKRFWTYFEKNIIKHEMFKFYFTIFIASKRLKQCAKHLNLLYNSYVVFGSKTRKIFLWH